MGHPELVKMLLEAGADPLMDGMNGTPMDVVIDSDPKTKKMISGIIVSYYLSLSFAFDFILSYRTQLISGYPYPYPLVDLSYLFAFDSFFINS